MNRYAEIGDKKKAVAFVDMAGDNVKTTKASDGESMVSVQINNEGNNLEFLLTKQEWERLQKYKGKQEKKLNKQL